MTTSIPLDFSTYDYSQLAQSRPSGTTATSLLSPAANQRFIVTGIIVANTTGSVAAYSLYHDEDGTTYDQSTALAYAIDLAPNSHAVVELSIPMIDSSGNLAIQTDTADALTFTAYGLKKRV